MLKHRILKSPFGQHYHIHSNRDGTVPRSLKALSFISAESARAFLLQLRISEEYWRSLAQGTDEMAPQRGHQRDTLQVICNRLASGQLRIYPVQTPDNHLLAGKQTVIQDRRGDQYHFAPASYSLTRAHKPRHFPSLTEIHQLLHDLAPTLEQLQSLATALQITPSPQSLTYTQLVDVLAESLADEKIVLYIQSPFKRPKNTGALEASALVPGNRPVPLAPPTKPSPKKSEPQTQPSLSASSTTSQAPQNLDECEALLKAARVRLDEQGYKAKYTDEQLQTLAKQGELDDRFVVRVIETKYAGDDGYLGQMNNDEVKFWSTTFNQMENGDTDPPTLCGLIGVDYKPEKSYSLVIVDTEAKGASQSVTIVPTHKNLADFAKAEIKGINPETVDAVMTPEYNQEYAEHMAAFKASGGSIDNEKSIIDYANANFSNGVDKERFAARAKIHEKLGANEHYTGDGTTKNLIAECPNECGVMETFTYDKSPQTLGQLETNGGAKRIAMTPR